MNQSEIFQALNYYYPDGFTGGNAALPSPSNYAEYVIWAGEEARTEGELEFGLAQRLKEKRKLIVKEEANRRIDQLADNRIRDRAIIAVLSILAKHLKPDLPPEDQAVISQMEALSLTGGQLRVKEAENLTRAENGEIFDPTDNSNW